MKQEVLLIISHKALTLVSRLLQRFLIGFINLVRMWQWSGLSSYTSKLNSCSWPRCSFFWKEKFNARRGHSSVFSSCSKNFPQIQQCWDFSFKWVGVEISAFPLSCLLCHARNFYLLVLMFSYRPLSIPFTFLVKNNLTFSVDARSLSLAKIYRMKYYPQNNKM